MLWATTRSAISPGPRAEGRSGDQDGASGCHLPFRHRGQQGRVPEAAAEVHAAVRRFCSNGINYAVPWGAAAARHVAHLPRQALRLRRVVLAMPLQRRRRIAARRHQLRAGVRLPAVTHSHQAQHVSARERLDCPACARMVRIPYPVARSARRPTRRCRRAPKEQRHVDHRIPRPPASARWRWSGRRPPARPAWPRRCSCKAGAIGAPGSLERGTTVSDFDPLERRMQHSLNAGADAPARTATRAST